MIPIIFFHLVIWYMLAQLYHILNNLHLFLIPRDPCDCYDSQREVFGPLIVTETRSANLSLVAAFWQQILCQMYSILVFIKPNSLTLILS